MFNLNQHAVCVTNHGDWSWSQIKNHIWNQVKHNLRIYKNFSLIALMLEKS